MIGLGISVVGLLAWVATLTVQLRRYTHLRRRLLQDPAIDHLETTLAELLERVARTEDDLRDHRRGLEHLAGMLQRSLAAPAILRYNAFENISGSQSFSLAVLDRERSGFVLTSLAGREGIRLYMKPVVAGASDIPLSAEEEQVLKEAVSRTQHL